VEITFLKSLNEKNSEVSFPSSSSLSADSDSRINSKGSSLSLTACKSSSSVNLNLVPIFLNQTNVGIPKASCIFSFFLAFI
jgi:hypothetical protein